MKQTPIFILIIVLLTFLIESTQAAQPNRWLFIGDSHSAFGMGDGLRKTLFEEGLVSERNFYQYSVSGSAALHWLYGMLSNLAIDSVIKLPGKEKIYSRGHSKKHLQDFETLNRRIHPTMIIFELGTNDSAYYSSTLGASRSPSSIPSEPLPEDLQGDKMGRPLFFMRRLLQINTQAKCVFVLPPKITSPSFPKKDLEEFTDRLAAEVARRGCMIVDSRKIADHSSTKLPSREPSRWEDCLISENQPNPLTPDRPDGIHFEHSKGEYWGRCVGLFLKRQSSPEKAGGNFDGLHPGN